ncbi:MAG: 6-phosphofructokinase [Thermoguttaceae bacterium]|nr:6-phosphofructokinase [Thermoguttaceae bacterium]
MKIGVLCSGGDAPGMNPALRAIVRAGNKYGDDVVGICRGYQGLLNCEFWGGSAKEIDVRDVSGLTSAGGAFLNSSRSDEMRTEAGLQKAANILRRLDFDALITIGGNGTLSGARELGKYWDGQIIGIPGTIDNDCGGTEYTIGFATAAQTGVEAIDKLRDTAGSHDMMFIVEVMGRHCGDLALFIAVASGAELVAIPEVDVTIQEYIEKLERFKIRGKRSMVMVVAEGNKLGGAYQIMNALKEAGSPYEMRAVVLGHIQRGGSPTPTDRLLATRFGCEAIDSIHKGETGKMIGLIGGELALTPLEDIMNKPTDYAAEWAALLERVAV